MIDKDVLKKIRHVEIYTRRLLSGSLIGESRSAIKGTGLEFDQIREYQAGDDVRFIDWNASARMNKLLIKQYIEERNRTVILAVDVSASTLFSSSKYSKKDTIAQIAAVLAMVSDCGKDQVSLILFSERVECFIPPNSGRKHVRNVMKTLFEYTPRSKKTDMTALLKYVAKMKRKDAILFVISDFIDHDFQKDFGIIAKMYEMVAIRCLDKNEQSFPSVGFVTVEDTETGQQYTIDTRKTGKNGISNFLGKRLSDQATVFKKYGVDFLEISNQKPFIGDLVRFFRRRMQY